MTSWIVRDAIRGVSGIVFVYLVLLVARLLQRRVVVQTDRDLGVPPRHQR